MIRTYPDEHVIVSFRLHWFVLFKNVVPVVVMYFFVLIGLSLLSGAGFFHTIGDGPALFWLSVAGATLAAFLTLSIIWLNYYLDTWVISDKRIFDIEQLSLFSREVSEFRIERIQDITVEVRGIIATLLNFGNVHVQTAGAERTFVIRSVKNPYRLKDVIFEQIRAQGHNTAGKPLPKNGT